MPDITDINTALGELEEELKNLKTASELIGQAKDAADLTRKVSEALNTTTSKLVDSVNRFVEKVDKIDFPTRLDKVDATISGINSGIQNIQSRFDSIERNLKDDFESKTKSVKERIEQVVTDIQNIQSKLDNVERNLKDDFESKIKDVKEKIGNKVDDFKLALEKRYNTTKYLLIVTVIFSVSILAFSILVHFKVL